jgi:hypothetical protein
VSCKLSVSFLSRRYSHGSVIQVDEIEQTRANASSGLGHKYSQAKELYIRTTNMLSVPNMPDESWDASVL